MVRFSGFVFFLSLLFSGSPSAQAAPIPFSAIPQGYYRLERIDFRYTLIDPAAKGPRNKVHVSAHYEVQGELQAKILRDYGEEITLSDSSSLRSAYHVGLNLQVPYAIQSTPAANRILLLNEGDVSTTLLKGPRDFRPLFLSSEVLALMGERGDELAKILTQGTARVVGDELTLDVDMPIPEGTVKVSLVYSSREIVNFWYDKILKTLKQEWSLAQYEAISEDDLIHVRPRTVQVAGMSDDYGGDLELGIRFQYQDAGLATLNQNDYKVMAGAEDSVSTVSDVWSEIKGNTRISSLKIDVFEIDAIKDSQLKSATTFYSDASYRVEIEDLANAQKRRMRGFVRVAEALETLDFQFKSTGGASELVQEEAAKALYVLVEGLRQNPGEGKPTPKIKAAPLRRLAQYALDAANQLRDHTYEDYALFLESRTGEGGGALRLTTEIRVILKMN